MAVAHGNSGSFLWSGLGTLWLTRLFFKASDSHNGLLRADLTSEPSYSVPFLSWDTHREIFP